MKKFFILLALLICGFVTIYSSDLKEGDIVFQISKSQQSPMIMLSTKSLWSHCGIIIEKDNNLYVLEASNIVKLTPYKEWKNKGRFGIVSKRRIFDKNIKIKYKKYLNKAYDLQFKFGNNKYYCSELVWDIYKNQFDTILAKPHPISDYNITNKKIINCMKQRNINIDQLVVSPDDIK